MSLDEDERKNIPARYKQVEKLGSGAIGNVYRARDSYMDCLVAIKLLNASYHTESQIRFQREAKAASRLKHRNLVTILDFGFGERNQPYLVMQYVNGPTLKELIGEKGVLSASEACKYIGEVLSGLEHAHVAGVLHRDIKPANIVIEEQGEARVLDFGLAKMLGEEQELTSTGAALGTPYYMSPEQADARSVDHRADIYSVGCVLYECLTGKRPFAGATAQETIMMHMAAPIPSLREFDPSLPAELDEIIARALSKRPEDRFQSAGDMASALRFVFDGVDSVTGMDSASFSSSVTEFDTDSERRRIYIENAAADAVNVVNGAAADAAARGVNQSLGNLEHQDSQSRLPVFSSGRFPGFIFVLAAIAMAILTAGGLTFYGWYALFANGSGERAQEKGKLVYPGFRVERLADKAEIVVESASSDAAYDAGSLERKLAVLSGVREVVIKAPGSALVTAEPPRVRVSGLLYAVHKINPRISRLQLLNVRLAKEEMESLSRFENLEYLLLRNNALDDGVMAPLADLCSFRLRTSRSLGNLKINKTLVLKDQFIADQSLKFIGELKGLKSLYLGRNLNVKGSGLKYLNDLELTTIGLSDTGCAPEHIVEFLKHQKRVRSLSLGSLNLDDTQLQAMLAHCPSLIELSVSGNRITDNSIDYILVHCKKLKRLDLRKCYGISDEGLQKLREIPSLSVQR